ncbi:hypothetical protein [Shewanella gaetbuli]|uniref:Uncharacterized protein n=1 Tax=Shewanella gaetbuli TaxID=220752 RepID=A0A9X2CJ24_9GAMM|nr:hypothetical protein [Shewanella gaetbuli]MCL1141586.1 hypothetical protein [Shewanella gaetbuli]
MKNWLNKFLRREPAPVRNKVQVDLHYHTHQFSMDDFKNAKLPPVTDDVALSCDDTPSHSTASSSDANSTK